MRIGIGLPEPRARRPGHQAPRVGEARGGAGLRVAGDHRPARLPEPRLADDVSRRRPAPPAGSSCTPTSCWRRCTRRSSWPRSPRASTSSRAAGSASGSRSAAGRTTTPWPGVEFGRRGRILDEQLALLHQAWRGEPVAGSAPSRRSGAGARPAGAGDGRRHQRRGDPPGDDVRGGLDDGRRHPRPGRGHGAQGRRRPGREAGRAGEPRLAALAYFSLGDDAVEEAAPTSATTTRSSARTPTRSPTVRSARRTPSGARCGRSRTPASPS